MIENLRLDPAGKTIDSTNTNNPTSSFTTTAANLFNSTFVSCTEKTSPCIDQISVGLGNLNRTNNADSSLDNQNSQWYSYGALYNWYTATAGHGTYSVSSSNTIMGGDICPSGWHLPKGNNGNADNNTSGSYYYLNYKLNGDSDVTDSTSSANIRSYPNNFVLAGYYSESTSAYRSIRGYYWSNMAYGQTTARALRIYTTSLGTATNYYDKRFGLPIRCLAN